MKTDKTQVGGKHYKVLECSPFQFMRKNFGPAVTVCNLIKYACRYPSLMLLADLEKIKQYCDLEIEFRKQEDHDKVLDGINEHYEDWNGKQQ